MIAPTQAELTRAAELAERLSELIDSYECVKAGTIMVRDMDPDSVLEERCVNPLDPRAFQAVVLALPPGLSGDCFAAALMRLIEEGPVSSHFTAMHWYFTPAGMLSFYEALVALADSEAAPSV